MQVKIYTKTEKKMKNLKEHFPDILEACRNCAGVGNEEDPVSTSVCYDGDDIIVEISFIASGRYYEEGDGYNSPCVTYLTNVHVSVEEISGFYIFNDDGEENIPDSELNDLSDYLEKELPSLLEEL